jgi:hypothetical protein
MRWWASIVSLCVLTSASGSAQSVRSVVAAAAVRATAPAAAVVGTLGQPIVGSSAATAELRHGFWYGVRLPVSVSPERLDSVSVEVCGSGVHIRLACQPLWGELFSLLGQCVWRAGWTEVRGGRWPCLPQLPTGIYLLRLHCAHTVHSVWVPILK